MKKYTIDWASVILNVEGLNTTASFSLKELPDIVVPPIDPVDPIDPPDPVDPPVVTKFPLGTNLAEIRDWMTDEPFVNHFKHSRKFTSTVKWGPDDDGRALPYLNKHNDTINLGLLKPDQILQTYAWTTRRRPGKYYITYYNSKFADFYISGVTSYKEAFPVGLATGEKAIELVVPELGNIKIVITPNLNGPNPDFMRLVHEEDFAIRNEVFTPRFIADVSKYNTLRFMDWQHTNFVRTQEEQAMDLVPDKFRTYADAAKSGINAPAVPIETLVLLCNKANVNGWICIPYKATDTYIRAALKIIQDKLNPGLVFYVEHMNEVWNSQFSASKSWETDNGGYNQGILAHARRSGQIAKMCKEVAPIKTKSVLGGWINNVWHVQNALALFQAESLTKPDFLCVGFYQGGGSPVPGSMSGESYPALADTKEALMAPTGWARDVKVFSDLLKQHIITYGAGKVLCYEGGTHILKDPQGNYGTDNAGGLTTSRIPEMEQCYDLMFKEYQAAGGGLFCHFNKCCSYSKSGSWGEKEHFYQADTAKSRAIGKILGR